jgi:hypothetical protein
MPATLTEEEFAKHVNTTFRVRLDAEQSTELELVEVKGYPSKHNEHSGMERFSLYFNGPATPFLPQMLYTLNHDQMGEVEVFLVPLSRDEQGFRYEAVFNYFKPNSDKG